MSSQLVAYRSAVDKNEMSQQSTHGYTHNRIHSSFIHVTRLPTLNAFEKINLEEKFVDKIFVHQGATCVYKHNVHIAMKQRFNVDMAFYMCSMLSVW